MHSIPHSLILLLKPFPTNNMSIKIVKISYCGVQRQHYYWLRWLCSTICVTKNTKTVKTCRNIIQRNLTTQNHFCSFFSTRYRCSHFLSIRVMVIIVIIITITLQLGLFTFFIGYSIPGHILVYIKWYSECHNNVECQCCWHCWRHMALNLIQASFMWLFSQKY